MKLLSVNISPAKQVTYKDKTFSTGIFKQPVQGLVDILQFNLNGDEQVDLVNHGGEHKAVYAFSADHYAHWQHTLELAEIKYGRFGENLTISELDEQSICIGDQLQVGTAILEVSQPRVPCFKLGMTFNNEKMPKLFIEQAETGIYFRVIETGKVQAGDAITIISKNPAQLAVKTLFRAYFDKTMPEQESLAIMQKAAKIKALSGEWMEKVESRLG